MHPEKSQSKLLENIYRN